MRNRKLILSAGCVLLLLGALACSPCFAQSAAPAAPSAAGTKTAVCDVVQIFTNYQRAKDLTAMLNEKREGLRSEDEKRKKVIEDLQKELEELKESSPEYDKRFQEMQKLLVDRDVWTRLQESLMLREHHRLTRDMYQDITKAVEQVAKEKGFQLVIFRERELPPTENTQDLLRAIERRTVLYSDDNIDITEAVLAKLNETYRSTKH
jgi:Skp family chaperone for outer membrane proteins